jgi:hypothetical protein
MCGIEWTLPALSVFLAFALDLLAFPATHDLAVYTVCIFLWYFHESHLHMHCLEQFQLV